jgi:hypothetical protein
MPSKPTIPNPAETTVPAGAEPQPTARERMVDAEARHMFNIWRQSGRVAFGAAVFIADEAGVPRRTIERARHRHDYRLAVDAQFLNLRLQARWAERSQQFFARQRRAALGGRWDKSDA